MALARSFRRDLRSCRSPLTHIAGLTCQGTGAKVVRVTAARAAPAAADRAQPALCPAGTLAAPKAGRLRARTPAAALANTLHAGASIPDTQQPSTDAAACHIRASRCSRSTHIAPSAQADSSSLRRVRRARACAALATARRQLTQRTGSSAHRTPAVQRPYHLMLLPPLPACLSLQVPRGCPTKARLTPLLSFVLPPSLCLL